MATSAPWTTAKAPWTCGDPKCGKKNKWQHSWCSKCKAPWWRYGITMPEAATPTRTVPTGMPSASDVARARHANEQAQDRLSKPWRGRAQLLAAARHPSQPTLEEWLEMASPDLMRQYRALGPVGASPFAHDMPSPFAEQLRPAPPTVQNLVSQDDLMEEGTSPKQEAPPTQPPLNPRTGQSLPWQQARQASSE